LEEGFSLGIGVEVEVNHHVIGIVSKSRELIAARVGFRVRVSFLEATLLTAAGRASRGYRRCGDAHRTENQRHYREHDLIPQRDPVDPRVDELKCRGRGQDTGEHAGDGDPHRVAARHASRP
jgi:hypothetical protein